MARVRLAVIVLVGAAGLAAFGLMSDRTSDTEQVTVAAGGAGEADRATYRLRGSDLPAGFEGAEALASSAAGLESARAQTAPAATYQLSDSPLRAVTAISGPSDALEGLVPDEPGRDIQTEQGSAVLIGEASPDTRSVLALRATGGGRYERVVVGLGATEAELVAALALEVGEVSPEGWPVIAEGDVRSIAGVLPGRQETYVRESDGAQLIVLTVPDARFPDVTQYLSYDTEPLQVGEASALMYSFNGSTAVGWTAPEGVVLIVGPSSLGEPVFAELAEGVESDEGH